MLDGVSFCLFIAGEIRARDRTQEAQGCDWGQDPMAAPCAAS